MKRDEDLEPEEAALRHALLNECPTLRTAVALVDEFARIVRYRRANELDTWIALASGDDAPADLRSFARGLTSDLAAVRAALTQPWSNGQVEGQVNRLKLVKRQMYGRANFDLLRARFLHAG